MPSSVPFFPKILTPLFHQTRVYKLSISSCLLTSGGGAADQSQTSAEARLAVLEHPREAHPPRLLLRAMASLPIPDELLAEIFLRLPTPADLARASAACVSFRRVAAGRSFVRRFRKLHAPPLLGFLERPKAFHPAIAPHHSASAARVVSWAADFSFSFLPAPARHWAMQDTRDGRVVLYSRLPGGGGVRPLVPALPPASPTRL